MRVEVPFEIVKLEENSYHLFVECIVNGNQKGDLVIDTGASKTVLDGQFLQDFQDVDIDQQEIQSSGLGGGVIDTQMVKIESLQIGELQVQEILLARIDLSSINKMYEKYCHRRICGLLGSDFLLEHGACIDYSRRIMSMG